MTWDGLLLYAAAALGLLLVLMPVYTALRYPAALSWGQAALAVGAGYLAALLLTVAFTGLFNLLSALVPGLNPFVPPAYEPIDAGLFSLFVGLAAGLAAACLVQFRALRRRVRHRRTTNSMHSDKMTP